MIKCNLNFMRPNLHLAIFAEKNSVKLMVACSSGQICTSDNKEGDMSWVKDVQFKIL